MPIGNEVGTLSFNATSITKGVDGAGNHTFAINCEGTVSGGWQGTSLMTVNVVSKDLKSGTYTATAAIYLEDGSSLTADGDGVLGALGERRWQMNGIALLGDSTRAAFEGVLVLADHSLNGKLYAII
jgi:hypothetical protein